MTTFRAHFDGRALIPDEPIQLPVGQSLEVHVMESEDAPPAASPLVKLAGLANQFPANPDLPEDGAAQHDHYLYGVPRRP